MSHSSTSTKGKEGTGFESSIEEPPSYEPAAPTFASSSTNNTSDTTILPLPLLLPTVEASASEVRTYIRSYLHHNATKYDLSSEDVVHIASSWRYGTGQELRSYTRSTWETLFDLEMGQLLSKHVVEAIAKERQENAGKSYASKFWVMTVCCLIIGTAMWLTIWLSDGAAGLNAWIIVGEVLLIYIPFGLLLIGTSLTLIEQIKEDRTKKRANKAGGQYVCLEDGGEDSELQPMSTV